MRTVYHQRLRTELAGRLGDVQPGRDMMKRATQALLRPTLAPLNK